MENKENQRKSSLKKIGITGSIGTGKSTVLSFFANFGATTFSCDASIREALKQGGALVASLPALFGNELCVDGDVLTAKLAALLFSSPEKLAQFEAVVHPFVFSEMKRAYENAQEAKVPLFVAEVPLLFESKVPFKPWFDVIITVVSDQKTSLQRYLDSGKKMSDFIIRWNKQLPQEQKAAESHYVLHNNGTLAALKAEVEALYNLLTA